MSSSTASPSSSCMLTPSVRRRTPSSRSSARAGPGSDLIGRCSLPPGVLEQQRVPRVRRSAVPQVPQHTAGRPGPPGSPRPSQAARKARAVGPDHGLVERRLARPCQHVRGQEVAEQDLHALGAADEAAAAAALRPGIDEALVVERHAEHHAVLGREGLQRLHPVHDSAGPAQATHPLGPGQRRGPGVVTGDGARCVGRGRGAQPRPRLDLAPEHRRADRRRCAAPRRRRGRPRRRPGGGAATCRRRT